MTGVTSAGEGRVTIGHSNAGVAFSRRPNWDSPKFELRQDLGLWMEIDHHTVNPREARVGTKIR